jgi:hypothetical protein
MSFESEIQRMNPKVARTYVEAVGMGVRVLLDVADPARLERGSEIKDRVTPVRDGADFVTARVRGTDPGQVYDVTIALGTIAQSRCDCPDFGRNGPCKHVCATAGLWLERVARPMYRKLARI